MAQRLLFTSCRLVASRRRFGWVRAHWVGQRPGSWCRGGQWAVGEMTVRMAFIRLIWRMVPRGLATALAPTKRTPIGSRCSAWRSSARFNMTPPRFLILTSDCLILRMPNRHTMSSSFRRPLFELPTEDVPMEWNRRAWPSGQAIVRPRAVLPLRNRKSSSGRCTVVKRELSWSSPFHALENALRWTPQCGRAAMLPGTEKFRDGARPNATAGRFEAWDRWAKPRLSRVNRVPR